MAYETIKFTEHSGVAYLTFNRPERLNSFTVQMHQEVAHALDEVVAHGARALLLTGAGRGFCAGQDLADRKTTPDTEVDLGDSLETYYNPLIRRLTVLDLPVICAVNGIAAGAGVSIALAGDIVIAAKSAKFIGSFAKVGLLPDCGGSWILPRLAGQARALGFALTGASVTAERAAEWGLIWQCVDDHLLAPESVALAQALANGPTLGLAATKRAIRGALSKTLNDALDDERDVMKKLGRTADYHEGVAAFLEKRPPSFTGT